MTYTFVTLLFLSASIVYGGHFPRVFKRPGAFRYPQRLRLNEQPLRLQDGEQFFMPYVNMPFRKTSKSDIDIDVSSLLAPKGDSVENLFDKNGMIVLTMSRDDVDRELNNLLNNMIYNKAEINDRALRNRNRDRFKKQMLTSNVLRSNIPDLDVANKDNKRDIKRKNMRSKLRSNDNLDLGDQYPVTPKHMFDFNEIVG